MTGNDSEIVLPLIAGTASILLIVVAIILFAVSQQKRMAQEEIKVQSMEIDYQKKMLKASMESQEDERKRVAKDLHDDVGMMLMTLRVSLNNQMNGQAEDLRELVDKTHESVRRISWNLMPSTLDNYGLFHSTKEMCERLSSLENITVTHNEEGKCTKLDKDQNLLIYRIVQESVINSIKHAHATKIEVRYQWTDDYLYLSVLDDGLGFELPSAKNKISRRHGLGLHNMENRITLLGANLAFEKNKPSGTIVSVTLPLDSHEWH